VKTAVT